MSAATCKQDDWWFQKLMKVEKLDTPSKTQSTLLSDMECVYELQFHRVQPSKMHGYLEQCAKFVELMQEKDTGAKLAGSWTCLIGDQDEAVHLWAYEGGYPSYNNSMQIYRTDPEIIEYRQRRNAMLRSRYNQILLRFAFWEFQKQREPGNMFEMRSYELRPGSTIEWGNHWARALKYRQENNAPVCGFFSHIGKVNMCHHLWAYQDLQSRKDTREAAWSRPGWDENVRYTVPLIKSLRSRILIPTPFSPLQ